MGAPGLSALRVRLLVAAEALSENAAAVAIVRSFLIVEGGMTGILI